MDTPTILETYAINYTSNGPAFDIVALGTEPDGSFHFYLKSGEDWIAVDTTLLDFDGDNTPDAVSIPKTSQGYIDVNVSKAPGANKETLTKTQKNYVYTPRLNPALGGREKYLMEHSTEIFEGDTKQIPFGDKKARFDNTKTEILETHIYDVNQDGAPDTVYVARDGVGRYPAVSAATYRIKPKPQN